jgi:hypothetical protein
MAWKRKIPDDVATLERHLNAGLDVDAIASIYGVQRASIRKELVRHGLAEARTRAVMLSEAKNRYIAVEPRKNDVLVNSDRITFTRDFYVQGKGFELRPLSLPRPSMYLAAIAKRYPQIDGVRHA